MKKGMRFFLALSLSLALSLACSLSFSLALALPLLSSIDRSNGFLVAQARRAPPLLALAVRGAQRRHGCRPGALRVRLGAGCRAGGAHGREDAGERGELVSETLSSESTFFSSTPTSTYLSPSTESFGSRAGAAVLRPGAKLP